MDQTPSGKIAPLPGPSRERGLDRVIALLEHLHHIGRPVRIGELARAEKLQPKPQEVRALIEAESQSYEHPAEVVKWFYMQPQRLSEMEGLALESNVIQWVLTKVKVEDKPVAFDELMGSTA